MTTGSTIARFTITLSKSVAEPVQVAWNTKDGTAKAGIDYAAASGTAVFSPGETNKDVDVLVYGRAVGTEDRNFFLEMTPPPNAILGESIGECIIYLDTAGNTAVIQVIVPTGPQGAKGDSAYQSWLNLGNTGTEQDFIDSLSPPVEEIAAEVAPILDISNSPLTAEGTETLSKPDTMTGKRLARRVAYVGAAKVATVVLADGDNLITHAALSGDAVDFNSISLYPRILRGTIVISPEWSVEPGDKILIKSAVAGDVLHVCQYDVTSERAVKNVVEPLVSAALAPVGSQAFEALRRSYAEAGYNVVGTFREGFTIVNANDVGIDEKTGKGFTGPAGTVAAGTDPASGGFVDRSGELLRQQALGMSYAQLRAYTGASTSIYVYGRENVFDGAFGWFDLVPSDTTSVDDDGITLVGADGRRWRRRYVGAKLANWFGGNTSASDISAALQKAVNSGKSILVLDGVYNQIGDVVIDYTSPTFPSPGSDTGQRVSLKGQSHSSTIIKYTGTGTALKLLGSNPSAPSQGINSSDDFGNFLMINPNGPAGVGLRMEDRAFADYERMTFFKFQTGAIIDGSLSSTIKNLQVGYGEVGIRFMSGEVSLCNALIFEGLRLQSNSKQGAVGTFGAGNRITGMTCEGNGTQADLNTGGMILNLRGDNGYACLTIDASYFEGNKGAADLLLDNVSAAPVTVKLTGCNFNRTSSTDYTVNNIKLSSSGGGALTLLTESCAFSSLNSYVPDPTRLFVSVGNNCEWIDVGSRFNELVSLGTSGLNRPYRSTSMNGNVNINGAITYAPRGVTASRTSTGLYNIKQAQTGMRFAADINSYAVTISPKYDGVSPAFYNVNKVSEKEFNVRFFDPAGNLINTDFDFVITANAL